MREEVVGRKEILSFSSVSSGATVANGYRRSGKSWRPLTLVLTLQLALSPLLCLEQVTSSMPFCICHTDDESFHKVLCEQCYVRVGIIATYNICSKNTKISYILNHLTRHDELNCNRISWPWEEHILLRSKGKKNCLHRIVSIECSKLSSLEENILLLLTSQLFKEVFFVLTQSSIATRLHLCTKKILPPLQIE